MPGLSSRLLAHHHAVAARMHRETPGAFDRIARRRERVRQLFSPSLIMHTPGGVIRIPGPPSVQERENGQC